MTNKEIKQAIHTYNRNHMADHFLCIGLYVVTGFLVFSGLESHFNSILSLYDSVSSLHKMIFASLDAFALFLFYIAADNLLTIRAEKTHGKRIFKDTFFIQHQVIRMISIALYFGMKHNSIQELIPNGHMTMFNALAIVLVFVGVFYAFEFCLLLLVAIIADMGDSLKDMFQKKPALPTTPVSKPNVFPPVSLCSVTFQKEIVSLQEKWNNLEEYVAFLPNEKISYLISQMQDLQQALLVYDQLTEEVKGKHKEEMRNALLVVHEALNEMKNEYNLKTNEAYMN